MRPTEQGGTVTNLRHALSLFKMGAPIHPIFVHFTIALTSASLVFDALGLWFAKGNAHRRWRLDAYRLRSYDSCHDIDRANIGFVGLGMHLRGLGRQMGGLYVTIFNWLEGPPAFAPALFTCFAGVGLIAVYFL